MIVIWTDKALNSYFKILDFLELIWNEDVADSFIDIVTDIEKILLMNPKLGKPKKDNIREIVLHINANLYYEYDESLLKIKFLLFKDNRQNPESYLRFL